MADISGETGEGLDIRTLVIGSDYLSVTPSGTFNVTSFGSSINQQVTPIDSSQNNPYYTFSYVTSGTTTGVVGSEIGSIIQFIGAGSYVQVFSWSNNSILNIGSWS